MTDLAPRRTGRPPSCTCGDCPKCRQAAYMREWWGRKSLEERRAHIARRNPERVAAAERARARRPERRETLERSMMRHPEHVQARRRVDLAVRRGHLTRLPCFCGEVRSEGHHPDYSRPLDVIWLCRRHHAERHLKAS